MSQPKINKINNQHRVSRAQWEFHKTHVEEVTHVTKHHVSWDPGNYHKRVHVREHGVQLEEVYLDGSLYGVDRRGKRIRGYHQYDF